MIVKFQNKLDDCINETKKGIFYSHLLHTKMVNLAEIAGIYLCTFLNRNDDSFANDID